MPKTAAPTGIEKARKLKLNLNDVRVLKALTEGPLFQFEIAKNLDISKQALSYNLGKLIVAKFAARQADKKFSVTDAGKKAVAGIS